MICADISAFELLFFTDSKGWVLGRKWVDPSRLDDRVDGDVQSDQPHGHILEADILKRVGVVEGNEHGSTADRINGSCRAPTFRFFTRITSERDDPISYLSCPGISRMR